MKRMTSILLVPVFALGLAFNAQATVPPANVETPAVEAPIAPVQECMTVDQAHAAVLEMVPDATIVNVTVDVPYTVEYTSPSAPTNLVLTFDINGCLVGISEVVSQ